MVKYVQKVQAEVRQKLEQSNVEYQRVANKHRRGSLFDEGDMVMGFCEKINF